MYALFMFITNSRLLAHFYLVLHGMHVLLTPISFSHVTRLKQTEQLQSALAWAWVGLNCMLYL